ncbi:MAG: hypothetical protein Q4E06_10440 [Lautropia sp.]|nr:hypothetical protein [Lautropia sp.]
MLAALIRKVGASRNLSRSLAMHRASDYWYLFKLAVKAVIFVVIFGTLGALLFGTPPGIPPPPANEAELRERAENVLVLMATPDLIDGDGRRQDVRDPFVENDAAFRRIWGPWESAENRASWTAYDEAYAKRLRQEITDAVVRDGRFEDKSGALIQASDLGGKAEEVERVVASRLTEQREQSKVYCTGLEEEWIARERENFSRSLTVDEGIYLARVRKQLGECRYWKSQALMATGA